jgi:hypothetical protein
MDFIRIKNISEEDFHGIVQAAGGSRIASQGSADFRILGKDLHGALSAGCQGGLDGRPGRLLVRGVNNANGRQLHISASVRLTTPATA